MLLGGASRVEPAALETHLGEPVERADADWIRERTGFAIGGIPPVGHDPPLRTVADAGLVQEPELWAAGGTPHTVFPLRGDDLLALTGAELATVAAGAISVEEARENTAEVAAAVAALVGELSRSAAPPGPEEVERIIASPAAHLLLARDRGRIVGMLTLVVFPIPTGVRAWIEDVVVAAAARERGVGAALNRAAIALARELARAPLISPHGRSVKPRTASTRAWASRDARPTCTASTPIASVRSGQPHARDRRRSTGGA